MINRLAIVGTFLVGLFISSCVNKDEELKGVQEYTGPILDLGPATTYYSDSAIVKMKMEAPRQLEFGNGDREFPEGLHLQFYDETGTPSSSLRANYCYYTSKEDLYKATGNVVIINTLTGDRLDTEELYWNETKGIVFTEKFVKIVEKGDLHTGEGLEAKQDFSQWSIKKYVGSITMQESNSDSVAPAH